MMARYGIPIVNPRSGTRMQLSEWLQSRSNFIKNVHDKVIRWAWWTRCWGGTSDEVPKTNAKDRLR
jgi:hypothetical protein